MKIGIWLGNTPQKTRGGAYSYTDRLIKLIDSYDFEDLNICFLGLHKADGGFTKEVVSISLFPDSFYKLISKSPLLYRFAERVDKYLLKRKGLKKILRNTDVGLVYYLTQAICFDSNFPFIATNWDIGHCSTYSFPEIMENVEYRNYYYRTILPKALMVLCDSETGKSELLKYTNIGEHKMRIFPSFAGEVSQMSLPIFKEKEILHMYGVEKNKFFFYPAQFWAHKNHYNLLKAFFKFTEVYPDFKLVFSGSDKGNLDYIKNYVSQLGLDGKVIFLGFASLETIYCMYSNATSLVMASHFGPTNMPPIEAMEIGCPIVCSDLGGHREILGNSAVYFNSFKSDSIYRALIEIVENRDKFLRLLYEQKHLTDYNADKSMHKLVLHLREALEIRKNWGM